MKSVNIKDIAIDGGTQQREKINEEIVAEYAEAMRCGAKFPAVTLFFDGVRYWLADGFHRFHASRAAELLDILADVREGTKRDAVLFSAGANGTHGMRLTNADKRKSVLVLLLDKEWTQWSNRQIAKHCHVTPQFVDKLRNELDGQAKKYADKVPTVGTPPVKPNNDAVVVFELPKKEAIELGQTTPAPAPEYTEADELRDQIADLQDMLAVRGAPEEEQENTAKLISDLRAEIKTLTATLEAVTVSRDSLMRKNEELMRQVKMQRKEIDKLRSMGAMA